ncbi:IS110 family transposase [Rhodococcoides kyotonense]|nr:IS110 family transposase [Rhodococcus kyotonensis]
MTENPPDVSLTVFAGVDTHKDTHHAAIIDHRWTPEAHATGGAE